MQVDLFTAGPVELLPRDGSAMLHLDVWPSDEAHRMFQKLSADLKWHQPRIFVHGREIDQPRLTAWYGDEGRAYSYSGIRLEPLPWTSELSTIRGVCEQLAGTTFNSVLANLYRNGADSVAWHADNEPELGKDPVIASVSLGAVRRFDLRHRATGVTVKTDLPGGSIVVMSGLSQSHWVHQVPKTARQVGPRINLTFRFIHV